MVSMANQTVPPHKHYELDEHAGQMIFDGKMFYPANVSVSLTRSTAFELIETIARQLAHDEPNRSISVYLVGELKEIDESE